MSGSIVPSLNSSENNRIVMSGKIEDESEPEKDGIKEGFLDRIGHRPLVHEGNLKIEIDPADKEEKDKNDVGDRASRSSSGFRGKGE